MQKLTKIGGWQMFAQIALLSPRTGSSVGATFSTWDNCYGNYERVQTKVNSQLADNITILQRFLSCASLPIVVFTFYSIP